MTHPCSEKRDADLPVIVQIRIDAFRDITDVLDIRRRTWVIGAQLDIKKKQAVLIRRLVRTADHHGKEVQTITVRSKTMHRN